MNGRSIGGCMIVGLVAALGCGGGGGPITGGGGPDPTQGAGYQRPPSTYDTPPGDDVPPSIDQTAPSIDQTAPSIDQPPPGSDTGGGGGSVCSGICEVLVGLQCGELAGLNQAQCVSLCETELVQQFDDCGDEYLDLLACAVRSPDFTCRVLGGDTGNGDFSDCTREALAFVSCDGEVEEPCQPGSCLNCGDACATCECAYGPGSDSCTSACPVTD